MMTCALCCSIYYMLMSVWGAIMLALMAIFFKIRSPNLFEDIKFNQTEWEHRNFSTSYIQDAYDVSAVSCGIASILYVFLFVGMIFAIRKNIAKQQHVN